MSNHVSNEIFKNPLLLDLNKFLKNDGTKISHVKKVVVLITDDKSVSDSVKFLQDIIEASKHLPKDDLQGISKAKSYVVMLKKMSAELSNFFAFVSKYEVDENSTKKLISNLEKAFIVLSDMIDYMNFAIKTHYSIESVKTSQKFTFLELKSKIAA